MPNWYTINLCTHAMKPSDPLLLADGTLRCEMYPTGKFAIPGFPQFLAINQTVLCIFRLQQLKRWTFSTLSNVLANQGHNWQNHWRSIVTFTTLLNNSSKIFLTRNLSCSPYSTTKKILFLQLFKRVLGYNFVEIAIFPKYSYDGFVPF